MCSIMIVYCFLFFFQAEDGIRYLVRSRGLGDVYKRQLAVHVGAERVDVVAADEGQLVIENRAFDVQHLGPVSYTHLTLPTSDLV